MQSADGYAGGKEICQGPLKLHWVFVPVLGLPSCNHKASKSQPTTELIYISAFPCNYNIH